ncbi:fimbrial protein [Dyella kyungheensis]|jgi:major type 1 subunit fimbrin (pilin)|uniref:fimbrial protein n=1 Tax=Dyella kyungheensis TaxID=1242174 RepID=UPI003CE6BB81
MKKTLFTAALAAAFGLVAMQASASDGQINFTGKITATNCTVNGGTGTDGAAKNITVPLDTVSTAALASAGATAGDHPFSLVFGGSGSAGCTDGTKVTLHFDSAATPSGYTSTMVNSATGNLKNTTATGAATNVEVGLTTPSGSAINMYTSNGSPQATIASGTATINYVARYVATGGASTAGDVATAVMYSVIYN